MRFPPRGALSGWILLCLLLAWSNKALTDEKPCTIHDGAKFYDLNPLSASKDYSFKSPSGHEIVLNVCKPVVHETWHLPHPESVAGYMRKDHGDFSMGTTNNTLSLKSGNPVLQLSNGSSCTSDEADESALRASTVVEFKCDMSVFSAGKPELTALLPPGDDNKACAFVIEWRTHYACETSERSGAHASIFVVLLVTILVLLMLYTVVGTLYMRFALNARGPDQIPEFNIPFLIAIFQWLAYLIQTTFTRTNQGLYHASHHWSDEARGARASARAGVDPEINAEIEREEREAILGVEHGGDLESRLQEDLPPPPPPPKGMPSKGVIRL